MRPSSEVGGDYFDLLPMDNGRLGLALGDATGHGIPAALLISSVALAFQAQAAPEAMPEAVLAGMNRALCAFMGRQGTGGLIAGFVYGLFDRASATLHYSNAGMPHPWLLRAGGALERLDRGGMPLGLAAGQHYQRGLLRLHPGDLLFLRSDGLADQCDPRGEAYGEKKLLEWIASSHGMALEERADRLVEELLGYGQGQQHDDICFIFMHLN